MQIEDIPRAASLDEIPIIDLANPDKISLAKLVRHACENSAFFYIANHGVSSAMVEGVREQARRFFSMSTDEKMAIHRNKANRGYLPLGTTHVPGQKKDLKESFDYGIDLAEDDPDVIAGLPLHGSNQWPDLPGFRKPLEEFFSGVRDAGMQLLPILSLSLDLDEDYFTQLYKTPQVLTRVIWYPRPEESDDAEFGIGARAHTDYGQITVLAPDPAGGLEIQLPDGEWISAPFIPDMFVVNLGDMMARWTNDVYRSTQHRVVNRLSRDRIAIPTFFGPDYRAVVECLPSCTGPDRPPKYEPIIAGEYGTYKIRTNQGFRG